MTVVEMFHKLPFPLHQRVFTVLVITAEYGAANENFIVVQLPVDAGASNMPENVQAKMNRIGPSSSPKHRNSGTKLVEGRYTSIESVKRKTDPTSNEGQVVWIAATRSTAGGIIPQFATTLAVPGELVKDVGYVIGWINNGNGRE